MARGPHVRPAEAKMLVAAFERARARSMTATQAYLSAARMTGRSERTIRKAVLGAYSFPSELPTVTIVQRAFVSPLVGQHGTWVQPAIGRRERIVFAQSLSKGILTESWSNRSVFVRSAAGSAAGSVQITLTGQ